MAGGDTRPTKREQKNKTEEGVLFLFQLDSRFCGNDGD